MPEFIYGGAKKSSFFSIINLQMDVIPIISGSSEALKRNFESQGRALERDWLGHLSARPPRFLCAIDKTHFHFIAGGRGEVTFHPEAQPGQFQEELWKYDVAEFFLASPGGKPYLEFNLAPNGAWWAARFSSPRKPLGGPPLSGVVTRGEIRKDHWEAQVAIPLQELGPLEDAFFNVTFIMNSPEQRFFTATPLGNGPPDFHRPDLFLPMSLPSCEDARQTAP